MKNDEYKDTVCSGTLLFEAFKAVRKSSSFKAETQKFGMDLLLNLAKLQQDLLTGKYKAGRKKEFILNERGKTRLIHSSDIEDKIFQHCLCDNILTPAVRRYIIYDNCASLKGRGISMSRKRLRAHIHKYYQKHKTNEGYILLMDFSGYYDNLRHNLVITELSKIFPKDSSVMDMVKVCLDSFKQDVSFLSDEEIDKLYNGKYKALDYAGVPRELKTGEKYLYKSLDIGDQCSQIIGVYYPTRIDNYIKIVRGQKYYGRYVDDSYIISNSKEELIDLLKHIKEIAAELGIILNDRKIKIVKLSQTFKFLQHKYFLTETGKLVERINPKMVTAERQRLKKYFNVGLPLKDIENNFNSWKGGYYKYMSKLQRKRLDKVFTKLKEEVLKNG